MGATLQKPRCFRWCTLILRRGLALLLPLAVPFAFSRSDAAPRPTAPPNHYLMLVAGNRANTLTPNQLALFQQSPYDALAVRFLAQYDTVPPPSVEEMTS